MFLCIICAVPSVPVVLVLGFEQGYMSRSACYQCWVSRDVILISRSAAKCDLDLEALSLDLDLGPFVLQIFCSRPAQYQHYLDNMLEQM